MGVTMIDNQSKIIKKAEKDARKLVLGDCNVNQIEMILRRRVSKELRIGIWNSYFDNINLYQLAFEAYIYVAEDERDNPNKDVSKEELEDFIEQVKQKKAVVPPGFEDMFDEENKETEDCEINLNNIK